VTLRIRHLRLRAETSAGTFGADIPLKPGLNVIWADNTKGKSTCLQGLLYALGVSIPRQSRGLYVVSRSKRLSGALTRPRLM
jgi:hypothetical protein